MMESCYMILTQLVLPLLSEFLSAPALPLACGMAGAGQGLVV
jgi:hypothetical protein